MKTYFRPGAERWCWLVVLAALITGLWAQAAWADTETLQAVTNLTLEEVVAIALRDNPQLQSLRARWAAMRERPAQARALPNPMSVYGGMDKVSGGSFPGTDEKRLMLQQELPFFGKRALRGAVAEKDAEAARREVDALTLDVIMWVKEGYFDLYTTERVIAITRQEEEVIRSMEKIAETMYATGQRAQVDVLKAQSEITILKQKLLELEAQQVTLKARLNTLLNRPANALWGSMTVPPPITFDENDGQLFAAAAANRPEIKLAQAQLERYQLERRLMVREFFPDYKLGGEYRDYEQEDSTLTDPPTGGNLFMFTVGIDLPIWLTKYRAGVREAEKMTVAAKAARVAAERQTSLDVQDAHFRFLTARRTLALYRAELIPQAEARFSASAAGYRTGKVDFLDFLESERFLLNARVMAAREEGTLGMQAARLERALGTALESAAVSLEQQ